MTNFSKITFGIFFTLVYIAAGILIIIDYFPYENIQELLKLHGEFELFGIKESPKGLMFSIIWLVFIFIFGFIIMPFLLQTVSKLYLYNHIITSPRLKVDSEWLNPSDVEGYYFTFANDEKLVVTHRNRKWMITFCAFLLFYCFGSLLETKEFFFFIPSIIFLTGLLYGIFLPAKRIIFNRMNGTVTIIGSLFTKTIPFEKMEVFGTGGASIHPCSIRMFMRLPIFTAYKEESWNFYVWYMDRNRPLPNGTLLDPYRDKDFKRRQAEGFPPPLYKAYCDITEETYLNTRKKKQKNSGKKEPKQVIEQPVCIKLTTNLIDKTDDDELLQLVLDNLAEKFPSDSAKEFEIAQTFTKPQQAIYVIWGFESEVTNSGFSQYYLNTDERFAALLPEALRLIGANLFAGLAEKANKTQKEKNSLEVVDNEFFGLYGQENLQQLQVDFIRANKTAFADDKKEYKK